MKHFVSLILSTTIMLCQLTVIAGPLDDKAIAQSVQILLVKENDIPNTKIDVISKNGIV